MTKRNFLVFFVFFVFAFILWGCRINKPLDEVEITIEGSVEFEVMVGDTFKINASIEYGDNNLEIEYASDKPEVATVDEHGNVEALAKGVVKISARIKDYPEHKVEAVVTVVAAPEPPKVDISDLNAFIPTNIIILGQHDMKQGDSSLFLTMISPANAYKGLVWQSSNPQIATVDQEGNVTAKEVGTTVISVYSGIDTNVNAEFALIVKDSGADAEVVQKVSAYLKSFIPKYVTESFELPQYPNPEVVVVWMDGTGRVITDGMYHFDDNITKDKQDSISYLIEQGFMSFEERISLKLIANPEDNHFEKLENIKMYLDVFFGEFEGKKVEDDIFLPTSLKGATLSWTSNRTDVISNKGIYQKPNNDRNITLNVFVSTGMIEGLFNYNLVAKGYTEEEKIAYLLSEGVLKDLVDLRSNVNIVLPTYDPRFGIDISWESDAPELFDEKGIYGNRDLSSDTKVNLTATLKEGDNEFARKVKLEVIATNANDISRAVYDFINDEVLLAAIPTHFPYGSGSNTIKGLPTSLEGHEGVVIEWAGNPEDFDGLTLRKQYLRYHDSYLTATFRKSEEDPITLTVVLNIGIAELRNSINIGGRFSEQKDTNPLVKYDLLHTFSYWDKAVGDPKDDAYPYDEYIGQQFWSYYSGYTFYIDAITDGLSEFEQVTDGSGTRYQYYVMDFVAVYALEADENGKVTKWDLANVREGTGGNWALFFVNLTGKEIVIPMGSHAAGEGSDGLPWIGQGSRDGYLGYDGYRRGFVADADGKVFLGSGFGYLQAQVPTTDPTISIPVGGYGMNFKTQEDLPIVGVFCQEGTTLTIERYELAPKNDYSKQD